MPFVEGPSLRDRRCGGRDDSSVCYNPGCFYALGGDADRPSAARFPDGGG
jgi:hypothetical protein